MRLFRNDTIVLSRLALLSVSVVPPTGVQNHGNPRLSFGLPADWLAILCAEERVSIRLWTGHKALSPVKKDTDGADSREENVGNGHLALKDLHLRADG